MRGRAAAVRDCHRAAQVVHLPPAIYDGVASIAETSALQVHVHHTNKWEVTANRCMLAQPCEDGKARQYVGRATAATQPRGTLPCSSLHPATRTQRMRRACVRSTVFTSSAESLSPICPPVQSSVSIRNSSPSCTVPTCAAPASRSCCAMPCYCPPYCLAGVLARCLRLLEA